LADGRSILAGTGAGKKTLGALIAATPTSREPLILFLDFLGIEVATSSFLREGIIGFRDYARASLENIYPVVANADTAVLEELEFFVQQRSDVLWTCSLGTGDTIGNVRLVGDLDAAQRKTFDLVYRLRTATANQLAAAAEQERIGTTAWNNRLAGLASKGLIVERRIGKTKTFSPLLECA
jgi:hypothetical protein